MINSKGYDFSFSGLKTAVLYKHQDQSKKIQESNSYINGMSKEIQNSIVDVLVSKTIKAAKNFEVKSIMIGGGVAANKKLRKEMKKGIKENNLKISFYAPPIKFCTDNASMIAATALFKKPTKFNKIKSKPNLRI